MCAPHRCQHLVLNHKTELRSYACRAFNTKYYDSWLMPENHTIESEIRFELFSIEPHFLADMSEIYYERSLFGIVSPCLAIGFGHIQCIVLLNIFRQFQFECVSFF